MINEFEFGTSVKVIYTDVNNEEKQVFAKIVCSNPKDNNIYSCITPHGSILKIHYKNVFLLSDDTEFFLMKEIETDALHTNRLIYNNLFN